MRPPPQRDYYSGLGKELPKDTMLLTLGCGKFRINNQEFGTLPGTQLPRMLDMGQVRSRQGALSGEDQGNVKKGGLQGALCGGLAMQAVQPGGGEA